MSKVYVKIYYNLCNLDQCNKWQSIFDIVSSDTDKVQFYVSKNVLFIQIMIFLQLFNTSIVVEWT